ncbi:MAG: hypothetical protein CL739_05545 [Chloroflexi bacterium]|nr:hypothetical protein [Chloroflexota bacterium]MEC7836604.1 hypothetical protein [Chloroflexota bacterium]|tara:strand:- start:3204 stop:3398 length:195 start_codon:yes stop_codon:yes gene_type:complete
MAHEKTDITVTVETDQADWLAQQAVEFGLSDDSKALRILIDFAIQEIDSETIFSSANERCRHCG